MFPGAAKIQILPGANPVARITLERNKPIYSRSFAINLQGGNNAPDTYVVAFPTPITDTNYTVQLSIHNFGDDPALLTFITAMLTTAPAQAGFTFKLSAVPLTNNYWIHIALGEVYNP